MEVLVQHRILFVGVLRSAPEPELETVDSSDHLHKIDHEVPWSEGFHPKFHIGSGMLGKRPGNMAPSVRSKLKKNNQQFNM